MDRDYGERKGYEEDHTDRDDFPEGVWEQIEAERRRVEGDADDDDFSEFTAAPEPGPPSYDKEHLEEPPEDSEGAEREQGAFGFGVDRGDLPDPF